MLQQCIEILNSHTNEIFVNNHYNIYSHDYSTLLCETDIDIEFGYTLKKSATPEISIKKLLDKENALSIYTDGSKSMHNPSAGTATISIDLEINIPRSLNPNASVHTAECIALLDAVKRAAEHLKNNIIIIPDSQSALLAIKNPKFCIKTNPYVLEVKKYYLYTHQQPIQQKN